jgi:hypothetical protein
VIAGVGGEGSDYLLIDDSSCRLPRNIKQTDRFRERRGLIERLAPALFHGHAWRLP